MPTNEDGAPDHHIEDTHHTFATTASDKTNQGRNTRSTTGAASTVTDYATAYTSAEEWIAWNGRKRWPQYPVNDQVWAMSIAAWATSGRTAA